MTPELLEQKIAQLSAEQQKAHDELAQLRPRVQYLEAFLLRCDGALTVLEELRQAPPVLARQDGALAAPGE